MVINTICVCGAGTMGSGIAQLSATAGFDTVLYELNEDILGKSKIIIEKNLRLFDEKSKISEEEKQKIFRRINFTCDLNDCIADVIIEAIVENIETKIELFNQLAPVNDS